MSAAAHSFASGPICAHPSLIFFSQQRFAQIVLLLYCTKYFVSVVSFVLHYRPII